MNKVFRVIWSQATQSWVAVSELTKAHKKQSSSSAKKSASGSSANLIKSSAIALSLLSGSAAYAAEAASGLIQINSTGGRLLQMVAMPLLLVKILRQLEMMVLLLVGKLKQLQMTLWH